MVAYNVNRMYYGNVHYMWCTPYFSSDYESPHYTVPPTSSPFEIYRQYAEEVKSGDQHGYKIKQNRIAISKGARAMHARGVIGEDTMKKIIEIARKTPSVQFRPLMCVISRLEAVPHYREVAISQKANPLSHEYIVADLPQSAFDVISVG